MVQEIKWKYEIGQRIKDDKRDMIIIDRKVIIKSSHKNNKEYKSNKRYYKYKCNLCRFDGGEHYNTKNKEYREEFWIPESSLIKGSGCSCCCNSSQIVVKGINDINTINPKMTLYFKDIEDCYKHTVSSSRKMTYKCPDCGFEKEITIRDFYNQGFSCKKCGDGVSYPNKFMFNVLEQLDINFEVEYSPDWIKPKRYDFYISSFNIILEMDGSWHTKDNKMSGQTIEDSKFMDDEKDRLANENGIEVIRIDCDYGRIENRFEFIKNNILNNKRINKLFDLSEINWVKCEEFSLKNLVKIICDYWNTHNNLNNENIHIPSLSKIFKLSPNTIGKHLKIGNKLKWCIYNGEEERISALREVHTIPVEIFKGNVSLGIFNTIRELILEYKKLGINLNRSHISSVALGKRKSHQGFTFKYSKDKRGEVNE